MLGEIADPLPGPLAQRNHQRRDQEQHTDHEDGRCEMLGSVKKERQKPDSLRFADRVQNVKRRDGDHHAHHSTPERVTRRFVPELPGASLFLLFLSRLFARHGLSPFLAVCVTDP